MSEIEEIVRCYLNSIQMVSESGIEQKQQLIEILIAAFTKELANGLDAPTFLDYIYRGTTYEIQ